MIGRSFLLASVFGALGLGVLFRPVAKPPHVDETWMESQYPTSVGKYTMQVGNDGSTGHSYKMDATTYETLKPYGIVGRVLDDGVHKMDVVMVSGDSEESFHYPLLCFQAQGWKVNWNKTVDVPTKRRGVVHFTVAEASRDGAAPQYAVFTFESPTDTVIDAAPLKSDMFWAEIHTGKVQFGTFFRFLSLTPNMTEDQVVQFAKDYMDASPVRPIEKLRS